LKLSDGLSHAARRLWARAIAFFKSDRGVSRGEALQASQGTFVSRPTADDQWPTVTATTPQADVPFEPHAPSWIQTVERIELARQAPAQPVTGPGVTGSLSLASAASAMPAGVATAKAREIVTRCAELANLEPTALLGVSGDIEAIIATGSIKHLDALLRSCCPKDRWPWPQADEVFALTGARGTRLQQVGLLTSMLFRQFMWASRRQEMKQSVQRRPYWQLRTAGGSRTPASCAAEDGRIEIHTHSFWSSRAPWACTRADCRCAVRTYSYQDLIDKGLPVPGQ
jgi:hypothetical protein